MNRHGDGAMPRLWSIDTGSLKRDSLRRAPLGQVDELSDAQVAARAGVRPGAEREPRPGTRRSRPATGPGRTRPVSAASPGTSSVKPAEEQGTDQARLARAGSRSPSRSTSRVVIRAVIHVGGVSRSVSHTACDRVHVGRGVVGRARPAATPRRRSGPGCRPPAWSPPAGGAVEAGDPSARASSSACRARARLARRAAPSARRPASGDHRAQGVDPVEDEVARRRPRLVASQVGQHRGRGGSGHRASQQHHGVVRLTRLSRGRARRAPRATRCVEDVARRAPPARG